MFDDLVRAAQAALDVPSMIAACQEVVRVPSLSHEEAQVASVFVNHLRRLGLDDVVTDSNGNVLAWLRGTGGGRSLMVNGHIDHVPTGDMHDPFSGALVDAARWGGLGQAIYGRGTCDMKCNVMASAYALGAIRAAGVRLDGDVIFVADVQEEIDSPAGVKSVVEAGIRADYGLSTESTGCRVYLGHRGKLEFAIDVKGRTAHASEPTNGVNAILEARRVLDALDDLGRRLPDDALFGPATVTVTSLRSSPDNATALVPDRCILRVDRRYVRGETPEGCEAELRRILAAIEAAHPDFRADLRLTNHYPLMEIDAASPLVDVATEAVQAVSTDLGARPGAWRFGVNGTFMSAAGIPTIGIGPGDERWAHTRDEHVPVADLERAALIWIRLIVRLCGTGGGGGGADPLNDSFGA